MIILGSRVLERSDGEAILNAAKIISKNSLVVNKVNGWNGFNILHREGSRPGALDIGLSTTVDIKAKKPKLIFLLGVDNLKTIDIPQDAFVVYLGTHGDEGAYYADLVLPGAGYTEKSATFVNTEGRT